MSRRQPSDSNDRQGVQLKREKGLSIGGRLALLKYVLGSLALHYFSVFHNPATQILGSLRSKLFWGGYEGKRVIHWVSWDQILNSMEEMGLGVGS